MRSLSACSLDLYLCTALRVSMHSTLVCRKAVCHHAINAFRVMILSVAFVPALLQKRVSLAQGIKGSLLHVFHGCAGYSACSSQVADEGCSDKHGRRSLQQTPWWCKFSMHELWIYSIDYFTWEHIFFPLIPPITRHWTKDCQCFFPGNALVTLTYSNQLAAHTLFSRLL